jgi:hypothetical protein
LTKLDAAVESTDDGVRIIDSNLHN